MSQIFNKECYEKRLKNPEKPFFKRNDADCDTYRLEMFEKNLMILLNHEVFVNGEEDRIGTEIDVQNLKNTFKKFNFEIEEYPVRTQLEILELLKSLKHVDYTDYGCVCVVVLSHGDSNGWISVKDGYYNEEDIFTALRPHMNPTLATKPRLFIFQTCREEEVKDELRLYSTTEGNQSVRKESGTSFIQALCSRLDERAGTEHLLSILPLVTNDVATHITTHKQTPVGYSTLTKKLKFNVASESNASKDVGATLELVFANNARTLDADCDTYRLEMFEKNYMIILNHEVFVNSNKDRIGTKRDVESLKNTFEKLNFEVNLHHDKKQLEILELLDSLTHMNFKNYGCICVVVLSHGNSNGWISAKDGYYNEKDIFTALRPDMNPTLGTKPRLFIFQTCRGGEVVETVKVTGPAETCTVKPSSSSDASPFTDVATYMLPVKADELRLYSTTEGNQSFRYKRGTKFIQALCSRLDERAGTEHLLSILPSVTNDVATRDEQTPVVYSTLTKILKFNVATESNASTE